MRQLQYSQQELLSVDGSAGFQTTAFVIKLINVARGSPLGRFAASSPLLRLYLLTLSEQVPRSSDEWRGTTCSARGLPHGVRLLSRSGSESAALALTKLLRHGRPRRGPGPCLKRCVETMPVSPCRGVLEAL